MENIEKQEINGIDFAEGEKPGKKQDGNQTQNPGETQKSEVQETSIQEEYEKLKKVNELLKEELQKHQQLVEELKDNWARERAEFQNYKKRMQQEIQNYKNAGIEEITKKLLFVLDNLDLVLVSKSDNPEVQNFMFGVKMVKDEFLKILAQYSIQAVAEKGDKFDPRLMEAIDVEIRDDIQEEVVLEVYKKGYVIDQPGRFSVLRVASVKVGKPGIQAGNDSGDTNNLESNDIPSSNTQNS